MATLWLVLFWGCRSEDAARALVDVSAARVRLSAYAVARDGFAKQSVSLAREALLDAERSVRGSRPSVWTPKVKRALDLVEIATWVAERQLAREQEQAEGWLDWADQALDDGALTSYRDLHAAAELRHREAQRLLAEAHAWFERGVFEEASEHARRSLDLAGELPPETKRLLARFDDPENRIRWQSWVESALAAARRSGKAAVVVDKRDRIAMLWKGGKPVRLYRVELGFNPLNPKRVSGDGATPEGTYRVTRKKALGDTRYYKALLLSYPNEEDRSRFQRERASGRIAPDAAIGGLIEIHGEGGRGKNWTDGCVALRNEEMDELFETLDVGSPVVIVGAYEGFAASGDEP